MIQMFVPIEFFLNKNQICTYYAILDTEAQLIFKIWSLNKDSRNRRAADNIHFHLHLIL